MERQEMNAKDKESLENILDCDINEENLRFNFEQQKKVNKGKSVNALMDESNQLINKLVDIDSFSKSKKFVYTFLSKVGVDLYAKDVNKVVSLYSSKVDLLGSLRENILYSLNSSNLSSLGLKEQRKALRKDLSLYFSNLEKNNSAIKRLEDEKSLTEVKLDSDSQRNDLDSVNILHDRLEDFDMDIVSLKDDLEEKADDFFNLKRDLDIVSDTIDKQKDYLTVVTLAYRTSKNELNRYKANLASKSNLLSYSKRNELVNDSISSLKRFKEINDSLETKDYFIQNKLISQIKDISVGDESKNFISDQKKKDRLNIKQDNVDIMSKVRSIYSAYIKR